MSTPVTVHHGDCLEVLRTLPSASVDAVVTDPPYGLGFMGREWDSLPPGLPWARECLRVLKPGGHMLAFGGTRTWHRLACAVEDAGFEVRDSIAWLYGSGFPKSLDVAKAINATERHGGANSVSLRRAAMGDDYKPSGAQGNRDGYGGAARAGNGYFAGELTDAARKWQGWGTALKPAFEPIVVARKPLAGTVAATVLAHGTGALNIDGCRVGDEVPPEMTAGQARIGTFERGVMVTPERTGRWPANVVLDESQAAALDEQSGETQARIGKPRGADSGEGWGMTATGAEYDDLGGASRFFFIAREDNEPCVTPSLNTTTAPPAECQPVSHAEPSSTDATPGGPTTHESLPIYAASERFRYVAKADASERVRVNGVAHPTVKPLALMRWLVRLVTPPGGTVLEPFAGSGTTVEACILEGFSCVAIEREADYLPLIRQRIARRRDPVAAVKAAADDGGLFDLLDDGSAT